MRHPRCSVCGKAPSGMVQQEDNTYVCWPCIKARMDRLENQNIKLRDAIDIYGCHLKNPLCASLINSDNPCDCGWDEVRKMLEDTP